MIGGQLHRISATKAAGTHLFILIFLNLLVVIKL